MTVKKLIIKGNLNKHNIIGRQRKREEDGLVVSEIGSIGMYVKFICR
jgi:hypothetical protein